VGGSALEMGPQEPGFWPHLSRLSHVSSCAGTLRSTGEWRVGDGSLFTPDFGMMISGRIRGRDVIGVGWRGDGLCAGTVGGLWVCGLACGGRDGYGMVEP